MTNIVPIGDALPSPIAPTSATARAVATVATMLPPKLTDGLTVDAWMKTMVEDIGQHPQPVLDEACRAVRSTCAFAPSPKEFIDAILIAYRTTNLPMSPDGRRHLAYRRKLNFRYVQSDGGRERFADDVKLTTIGYVAVAGVHANMVLDQITDATVTDVEKAIVETSKAIVEKATIDTILSRMMRETDIAVAHRIAGPPEGLITGPVARLPWFSHNFYFKSDFLCISQETVDQWRRSGAEDDRIMSEFVSLTRGKTRPATYGPIWQRNAERLISQRVLPK